MLDFQGKQEDGAAVLVPVNLELPPRRLCCTALQARPGEPATQPDARERQAASRGVSGRKDALGGKADF